MSHAQAALPGIICVAAYVSVVVLASTTLDAACGTAKDNDFLTMTVDDDFTRASDDRGTALLQREATRQDKNREAVSVAADTEIAVGSSPHVCILARTCGPSSKCSPAKTPVSSATITEAYLASIRAQEYPFFSLHLLNAEGGGEVFQDSVSSFKDSRFSNGPSSPTAFAKNTFGYEATNYALEQLLRVHEGQTAFNYFLFTNADNLYGRDFLELGLQSMQTGTDLIGFNFVTRYEQYAENGQLVGHMPMQQASFALGRIDLGAVLVSAQAIRELGLRFQTEPGNVTVPDPVHGQIVHDRLAIADWLFFQSIMNRSGSKGQVMRHELPFIHQF